MSTRQSVRYVLLLDLTKDHPKHECALLLLAIYKHRNRHAKSGIELLRGINFGDATVTL